VLRKEFGLVEGRDAAAAFRASVPKTAAMHEAGNARCQAPLPAKIRRIVFGKAQRTILHPGRAVSVCILTQWQQERRQRVVGQRHGRDRFRRNAGLLAEQRGDMAGKPKLEPWRPHPVMLPEHACERLRRHPVRERQAVDPARQRLGRQLVDGHRPAIARDIAVSLEHLDGEAGAGCLVPHNNSLRSGARRRLETGM